MPSPLRAKSFAGLAPAVIGTAVRNYDGLIHSFLNLFAIAPAADNATGELFTQLRQRLE